MESQDRAFAPLDKLIKELPDEVFTPEVKNKLLKR
jgi:hypothetical protein